MVYHAKQFAMHVGKLASASELLENREEMFHRSW